MSETRVTVFGGVISFREEPIGLPICMTSCCVSNVWLPSSRRPRLVLRRWRLRARAYLAWHAQGRPRDVPIVMGVGRLVVTPSSRQLTGWHFDGRKMVGVITAESLWDHLSQTYAVAVSS